MAADSNAADRRRIVVVTGGGAGIGAAIAEAIGRSGAYVVTVDPGVTVDGLGQEQGPAETTADRIVAAGGAARASNTSVTDAAAIDALFAGLVDEFGGLDAVINVAGISRPSGFAEGDEQAWTSVLSVHLDGYLNVLRAALPIMSAAGRGTILGVTSGSGWRPANAGAYSCAKRAVAALTWQLGKTAPPGVTVNALSPIAATRMVTSGLRQQAPATSPGDQSQTGGLSLAIAAMPSPEELGPVGAYLASDAFAWSTGNIIFSNGSEVAQILPPRALEVMRTTDVADLGHALDVVVPAAFVPAEAAQGTNGASNGRFADVFGEPSPTGGGAPTGARSCLVVADDAAFESGVRDALASRGVKVVGIGSGPPATDFVGASEQLAQAAGSAGGLDAVVVARTGSGSDGTGAGWKVMLDEHAGVVEAIRSDVAWVRAVSDHAARVGPADADRHRHRRHDLGGEEPRPGLGAALACRAPRDRHPDRCLRHRSRDRRRFAASRASASSPRTSSAPTTRGRCPAPSSWSPRSGSGCAATRTRRRPSRSAVRSCRRGSTTPCAASCRVQA